jgi:phosphoheptose isomerase
MNEMDAIVNYLKKTRQDGRYIFIMGNGGSAALAAHFACDLMKVCGCKAIDLSSNTSVITAYANDEGYEYIFEKQLRVLASKGDVVFAITASGTSHNIVKALDYVAMGDRGIATMGMVGFSGGLVRPRLDVCVHILKNNYQDIEDEFARIAHEIIRRLP